MTLKLYMYFSKSTTVAAMPSAFYIVLTTSWAVQLFYFVLS